MNQHNDQTVTLMELAATFETCIDFLPPAGRKNISRAVEQLRTYGELCRASAGREAVDSDPMTLSAPEKVWLQVNTDADGEDERLPIPRESWMDLSWCYESIGGHEVVYIREDLVPTAPELPKQGEGAAVLFRHSTDSNPMIGAITELLEDSGRYVVAVTSNGGGTRHEVEAHSIARALRAIAEGWVVVPRNLLDDLQLISEGVLPDGDGVDVSVGLWAERWVRALAKKAEGA